MIAQTVFLLRRLLHGTDIFRIWPVFGFAPSVTDGSLVLTGRPARMVASSDAETQGWRSGVSRAASNQTPPAAKPIAAQIETSYQRQPCCSMM